MPKYTHETLPPEYPDWLRKAKWDEADIELRDGVVYWLNGTWLGGVWFGGDWHGGIWFRGTWHDGTRHDGTWLDGEWLGGNWIDGDWDPRCRSARKPNFTKQG